MKMVEILEEIDGHTIISGFDVCPIDPEATKVAVEKQIAKNPALAEGDMETLFETYTAYSIVGPGRKCLTEAEHAEHKAKFDALREHERLTEGLAILPDYRGVEYWRQSGGRWGKAKIEQLGVAMPDGAVLDKDLSPEQRGEITAQQESDRVAGLSGEQKAAEKQARLDAAADEADRLSRRAQIQSKAFDAAAWYGEKAAEIEAKYAS
jgi:hypothetical protein